MLTLDSTTGLLTEVQMTSSITLCNCLRDYIGIEPLGEEQTRQERGLDGLLHCTPIV